MPAAKAFAVNKTALDHIAAVPDWLIGPILGKELRVSSRQRRHYVLRFLYPALLTVLVGLVWLAQVDSSWGSTAAQQERMSEAGKVVVVAIVWFQFGVLQLVAVVMLSTSISGEVYDRTLGVLLTTPIRMFQVVLGKLLSKLLQLLILLAISLPVLAVVRVFGGVPWDYVIASVCITFTACLVAGSVSMFFSMLFRRAFATIILTLAAGFVLYAVLPSILMMVIQLLAMNTGGPPGSGTMGLFAVLMHGNPFSMELFATIDLFQPMGRPAGMFLSWPAHCGFMLGVTVLVLLPCVLLVRRVALRQMTGDTGQARMETPPPPAPASAQPGPTDAVAVPLPAPVLPAATASSGRARTVRRLSGSPVLWKELRTPLTRSIVKKVIGIVVPLSIVAVLYLLVGALGGLTEESVHTAFVVVFVVGATLFTAVLAATPITSEKEARCWPLLLATPLSNSQIIWAKAVGVLWRCWPGWALLIAHVVVFSCIRLIHPIVLLHVPMLVWWVTALLTGTGLYFGARFRRTTTAVVMNLALAIVLWVAVPILLYVVTDIWSGGDDVADFYLGATNPVVQAVVIVNEPAGKDSAREPVTELSYDWPWPGPEPNAAETTVLMLIIAFAHSIIGLLFACLAAARLRRKVF